MKQNVGVLERYPKRKRGASGVILAGLLLVALIIVGGFFLIQRSKAQERQLFQKAKTLYQAKRYGEATTMLHDFLARYDEGPYTLQASYYLASAQQALGEYESALPLWQKLSRSPQLPPDKHQVVAYNLGVCLERAGNVEEALNAYRQATRGDDAQLAAASWLWIGEYYEQRGDARKAADAYREAAERYPETVEGKEAIARLNELTLPRVLKANAETYRVRSGDVLATIARKTGSTVGQIMLANGLRSPHLRVGDQLLIPHVAFSLDVGLEERQALLKANGFIVKAYPIAIGAPETPTPEGNFRIINKLDQPDWRTPEGEVIPYGDPRNELGTRWLGIASDEIPGSRGFGLHGTIDPGSIGQAISNGCLRFHNEDIEELFQLLRVGSPVRIAARTEPAQWYRW